MKESKVDRIKKAYEWIIKHTKKTGLIQSTEVDKEGSNPDLELINETNGVIYDQALAVIVFCVIKKFDRAKKILECLKTNELTKSGLYISYNIDTLECVGKKKYVFQLAWMIIAVNYYKKCTSDNSFKSLIDNCVDFIETCKLHDGSYSGGYDCGSGRREPWVSSTTCVVLYMAYNAIGRDTTKLLKYIKNKLWDSNEQKYVMGIHDEIVDKTHDPLDVGMYGFLAFGVDNIGCLLHNHINSTKLMLYEYYSISGFPFILSNTVLPDIWTEGTIMMGLCYYLADNKELYDHYLEEVAKVQLPNGGFRYSAISSWNGYYVMQKNAALSPTAWYILGNYPAELSKIFCVESVNHKCKSDTFSKTVKKYDLADYFLKNIGKGKTYFINIDKQTYKYNRTQWELKNIGVDPEKFRAAYWVTEDLLESKLNNLCSHWNNTYYKIENGSVDSGDIKISKGGLGCYVSHASIIKEMVDNKYDYVFINEDDMRYSNNISITDIINDVPNDWDIITLGSRKMTSPKEMLPFIYKWNENFINAGSYIVKRKAGEVLMKKYLFPIRERYDVAISRSYKELRIYNIDGICDQIEYISDVAMFVDNADNIKNIEYVYKSMENMFNELEQAHINNIATYDDDFDWFPHDHIKIKTLFFKKFIATEITPLIMLGPEIEIPTVKITRKFTDSEHAILDNFTNYITCARKGNKDDNYKQSIIILDKYLDIITQLFVHYEKEYYECIQIDHTRWCLETEILSVIASYVKSYYDLDNNQTKAFAKTMLEDDIKTKLVEEDLDGLLNTDDLCVHVHYDIDLLKLRDLLIIYIKDGAFNITANEKIKKDSDTTDIFKDDEEHDDHTNTDKNTGEYSDETMEKIHKLSNYFIKMIISKLNKNEQDF